MNSFKKIRYRCCVFKDMWADARNLEEARFMLECDDCDLTRNDKLKCDPEKVSLNR